MPSLDTGPQPESMGLPSEGPRLVADRYEILRLLGRGRMGEVYLADDHRGRKHVALKFCARDCGKDFHRLLVREVRLGQRVTHPNVCRIYDLDTHGDQVFLAMEFIDGSTLRQILDRTLGRLTCAERLRIAYGLCDGLAAIHGKHVLHRDLKPGNVMLDSAGRTVITDFGLAVQAHGAADQSGTPGYMAPELATGGPPSVQSDLFSLGLVLYELFTDRRTEYTEQRGRGPLEALDVPPDSNVPPEIFEVILRCLNRDPDKRPESAAAVAKDLPTPMLERESGESITSPATLLVLPRFAPSRIRSRWTLAALLVTVVVASLLGARWGPATALVDPPPVLEKSARDILRDLGFPPAPYRAWGFWHPSSWEGWGDERVPLVHLDSLVFWYRQGPRPIIQRQLGNPVLIPDDPPISDPGSVRVVLDASGTLLRLDASPAATGSGPGDGATPDLEPLFDAAGVRKEELRPRNSSWIPPLFADQRLAWERSVPNEESVRIEAASVGDRWVAFAIEPQRPWGELDRRAADGASQWLLDSRRWIFYLWWTSVMAGTFLLTWHNLRAKRADLVAARRLAIFVGSARLLVGLLGAHHLDSFAELHVLQAHFAWALRDAALVWMLYLALEPLARLWQPHRAASWVRLLYGRISDPRVGRDLMIGSLAGSCAVLWSRLYGLVPGGDHFWTHYPDRLSRLAWQIRWTGLDLQLEALRGFRHALAMNVFSFVNAVVLALFAIAGVLVLRQILRHAALTWWVSFFLLAGLFFPGTGALVPDMVTAAGSSGLWLFVLSRFGALAAATSTVCAAWLSSHPLTLDLSSWYAAGALMALLGVVALGVFGFRVSLAGQPALPSRLRFPAPPPRNRRIEGRPRGISG